MRVDRDEIGTVSLSESVILPHPVGLVLGIDLGLGLNLSLFLRLGLWQICLGTIDSVKCA
jgi:hypothetical protein